VSSPQIAEVNESAAAILIDHSRSKSASAFPKAPAITYASRWLENIRIQSNDSRLVQPFSDSIRLLPINSEQVQHGLQCLDAATSLLKYHNPSLPSAISELISDILFVESAIDSEKGIFSFSDDSAPNILYIAPYSGEHPLPAEDIADSILHEFLHQTLYHIEKSGVMLFDHVYPRFPAPWCSGLRPSGGFFHGTYVFTGLALFWRSLANIASEQALQQKAKTNSDLFLTYAAYGLQSLNQFALLTERGRSMIFRLAESICVDLEAPPGPPGLSPCKQNE
jgi:uncharacterized protein